MDREGADTGGARRPEEAPRRPEGSRTALLLTGFVAAFAVLQGTATLTEGAQGPIYPASLVLLAVLSGGLFLASFAEARPAAQRAYVLLAVLPILTLARLAFAQTVVSLLDPLLVYLLLAVTLLALRPSIGPWPAVPARGRRTLMRALVLGGTLAAGVTALGFALPLPQSAVVESPWLSALVLVPVALLDEFWFRGILQGSVAQVTSAPSGWIGVAVLFASYGEPFGPPSALLFRIALGLVLGALAMRRENLPATLVARAALTLGLLVVSPGLAGTSLLV